MVVIGGACGGCDISQRYRATGEEITPQCCTPKKKVAYIVKCVLEFLRGLCFLA
jgi:hypothetical protein